MRIFGPANTTARPDSWDHPDVPALTIARLVLNALEGLLWKSIRGAGLAYGASIIADVERGQLSFRVSVRELPSLSAF